MMIFLQENHPKKSIFRDSEIEIDFTKVSTFNLENIKGGLRYDYSDWKNSRKTRLV
jgi:hypothetical protein